jgi:hypothetical protein
MLFFRMLFIFNGFKRLFSIETYLIINFYTIKFAVIQTDGKG